MDRNNIRAAYSTERFNELEAEWKESRYNTGMEDFFSFITRPSAEREAFIREREKDHAFFGSVVLTKIN